MGCRQIVSALCISWLLCGVQVSAQTWSFGGQFGIITPNDLVGFREVVLRDTPELSFNQVPGYQIGGLVSVSYFSWLEVEAGLAMTQRRFSAGPAGSNTIEIQLKAYEIPIRASVYMRLTEQIRMGNTIGLSVDFFPSDVGANNQQASLKISRRNWTYLAVEAGHGYLLEGKKAAHYLGYRLHVPIGPMSQVNYSTDTQLFQERILASYLMLTYAIRGR